jgi:LPXTG-motif cell wall-anchored protein
LPQNKQNLQKMNPSAKPVEQKAKNTLPNTGDASTHMTVIGTMMAALSGLFFKNRKSKMNEK